MNIYFFFFCYFYSDFITVPKSKFNARFNSFKISKKKIVTQAI
jgi:hypothetical protein